jgi:hypothetical protein
MSLSDEISHMHLAMRSFSRDCLSAEWEPPIRSKRPINCDDFDWMRQLEKNARICVAQSLWTARCCVAALANGSHADRQLYSAVNYGVDIWFSLSHPTEATSGRDVVDLGGGVAGGLSVMPSVSGDEIALFDWKAVRRGAFEACEKLTTDLVDLRVVWEASVHFMFTNPCMLTPRPPTLSEPECAFTSEPLAGITV